MFNCVRCVCWAGIYAYIILKENVTESEAEIEAEMRALVRKKIAAYAVPDLMQVSDDIINKRANAANPLQ